MLMSLASDNEFGESGKIIPLREVGAPPNCVVNLNVYSTVIFSLEFQKEYNISDEIYPRN